MNKFRTIYFIVFFFLSLLLPYRSYAQINAEQVMNIGRNVMSMEDYMLSIQYFNQAIKAKPYLSDPYFFRALAKLYLEDFKGAEEDCTLAIERNKFKTESYKVRGFARQNLGKDSLAVLDYDMGLRHNPEDKYFLYYKALAQTQMKKYSEGASTFDRLLRVYPQFEDGYTARARMRIMEGDTVGAITDLDKALSISRNIVNAYLLRAQIRSEKKEWAEALQDMDAAIKLEPQEADYYVNRAYLRYNMDDYFGAMSDYNYTLELEPNNPAAMFNRALLRYEVKDLNRAAEDFKSVLSRDPENFHAIYNLALVDMERGENAEALQSLDKINKRYPKFYPAYYAKAEVYRNMGDMRKAMQHAHIGDDLVAKYVRDPERNPLDRPTIAQGKTHTGSDDPMLMDEDETDVMDRFNQLVTVVDKGAEANLTYNEKVKGRVQDRNLQVEPEPEYVLSLVGGGESLRNISNYFRELDDFNQKGYLKDKIYLEPVSARSMDAQTMSHLFERGDYYDELRSERHARPADLLALAIVRSNLKNYQESLEILDSLIVRLPEFTMGYMARAAVRQASLIKKTGHEENDVSDGLKQKEETRQLQMIIADYDRTLELNPKLMFAWFNKGNLYYRIGDFTSAIQCFSEAVRLDPSFGPAYYNRGLAYLHIGNKRSAFADLSKAGELGVVPSYNLLKRMK